MLSHIRKNTLKYMNVYYNSLVSSFYLYAYVINRGLYYYKLYAVMLKDFYSKGRMSLCNY